MIWTPLLICLAAICNSSMDITRHAWSKSIFNRLKPGTFWFYWFSEDSWKNAYKYRNVSCGRNNIPSQFTDNWHFAKMLMVIFMCIAILTYEPIFKFQALKEIFYDYDNMKEKDLNCLLDLLLFGACWNNPFSLFYNKVWRLKEYRK